MKRKIILCASMLVASVAVYGQCPSSGTITSNCTTAGDHTITGATLTINSGVTMTVNGDLTVQAGGTLVATGANIIANSFTDGYGGTNTLMGGTYTVSGDFKTASGGAFTMDGVDITATGEASFSGSDIIIANSSLSAISFTSNLNSMTISSSNLTTTGTGDFKLEDATVTNSSFTIGGELYVADGTTTVDNSDLDVGVGYADGVSQTAMSLNGSADITFTGNSTIDIKGHVDGGSGADITLNNSHMYVTGNVDNTGNGSIVVSNGGTLIVDGNYDNSGGGNTTVDGGGMVVGGTYSGGDPVVTGGADEGCSGGSGGCCGSACSSLPVTLISFDVKNGFDHVILSWTTATELNNDHFNIHRSTNGVDFEIIDWVAGNGTTDEQKNYELNDYPSQKGIYYYQLEQVDYDGKNEFFPVKKVNYHLSTEKLKVYPVPVNFGEAFFIDIPGNRDEAFTVKLFDVTGGADYNLSFTTQEGVIRLEPSSLELSTGVYILQVTVGSQQYLERISVQ